MSMHRRSTGAQRIVILSRPARPGAKFSPRAQAVFSLLIDNPGLAVTGEDIASKLDIPNGKRGVAGIVAWPARHCADAGYVPLFRCEEADGGYWMDPDPADLFARGRDAARPSRRPAS